MIPIVLLDSNALFGARSLARADVQKLLALSRMELIKLVVPDLVVQELARQWHERYTDAIQKAKSGLRGANNAITEIGKEGITLKLPPYERSSFVSHMKRHLRIKKVEIPSAPVVPSDVLIEKDLNNRKPFSRDGKGLRDALIWATIVERCAAIVDLKTPVFLVTGNYKDFCVSKTNLEVHPDLRADLLNEQSFQIVKTTAELEAVGAISELLDQLRVVDEYFSTDVLLDLMDAPFTALAGIEVSELFGEVDRDGVFDSPFHTLLESPSFVEVLPESSTIEFEVFRSDEQSLTIQVKVICDVSLDGFVHKADYYAIEEDSSVTAFEDWNDHLMRAGETQRIRFELSGVFESGKPETTSLEIDSIEDFG